MNLQRLDKIISSQTGVSRSTARNDIRKGRVLVDGTAERNPSFRCDPEACAITYDGQAVGYKKYIYLIINKPKGVISASEDKSRKTVVDLVPDGLKRANLFPVGRLDRDTTGLLIITDDGDFAHRVISPKKNIFKTYKVTLDGPVTNEITQKFAQGVTLADGTSCRPARLTALGGSEAIICISEGKYHQIKRMFGTVGLGVNELERIAVGGLKLPKDLASGQCRQLTSSEKDYVFFDI